MHASRPSGKLCIPAGRTNEFAFPWGNASPIAADRCRAAVDSGEILALQVLVCIPAVNYVMAPPGKPAGSGTARMDASKAAQMEEQIRKEQRYYFIVDLKEKCRFCMCLSWCPAAGFSSVQHSGRERQVYYHQSLRC